MLGCDPLSVRSACAGRWERGESIVQWEDYPEITLTFTLAQQMAPLHFTRPLPQKRQKQQTREGGMKS